MMPSKFLVLRMFLYDSIQQWRTSMAPGSTKRTLIHQEITSRYSHWPFPLSCPGILCTLSCGPLSVLFSFRNPVSLGSYSVLKLLLKLKCLRLPIGCGVEVFYGILHSFVLPVIQIWYLPKVHGVSFWAVYFSISIWLWRQIRACSLCWVSFQWENSTVSAESPRVLLQKHNLSLFIEPHGLQKWNI